MGLTTSGLWPAQRMSIVWKCAAGHEHGSWNLVLQAVKNQLQLIACVEFHLQSSEKKVERALQLATRHYRRNCLAKMRRFTGQVAAVDGMVRIYEGVVVRVGALGSVPQLSLILGAHHSA